MDGYLCALYYHVLCLKREDAAEGAGPCIRRSDSQHRRIVSCAAAACGAGNRPGNGNRIKTAFSDSGGIGGCTFSGGMSVSYRYGQTEDEYRVKLAAHMCAGTLSGKELEDRSRRGYDDWQKPELHDFLSR